MKGIKTFLITFFMVVLVGSIALIALPRKNAANNDKSLSADNQIMVKESHARETITIAPIEMATVYGGNVNKEIVDKEKQQQEISTLSGSVTDYEAMYQDAVNTKVIYPADEGKFTMTFAGDILFDPGYSVFAAYKQRDYDINQCISPVLLDKMKAADIMMINNEFPYSDKGEPLPDKMYTFRAHPSSVDILDQLGVDIVSLANNHTYDYGPNAFMDTLETLENHGMAYIGAGRNLEDASRPYYYVINGKKIAVIAASQIEKTWNPDTKGATETEPGVFRCYDSENLLNTIRTANEECDFVIVYVHWGTESTDQLDSHQITEAPKYVEAGADLIIGDHPHVLQPVGYINGVPVVYSLANFWFNSKSQDTCMITLTLNTDNMTIDTLQFIPCYQTNMSTVLLDGQEKERVLNYMRSISPSASIDEDGYITAK